MASFIATIGTGSKEKKKEELKEKGRLNKETLKQIREEYNKLKEEKNEKKLLGKKGNNVCIK